MYVALAAGLIGGRERPRELIIEMDEKSNLFHVLIRDDLICSFRTIRESETQVSLKIHSSQNFTIKFSS